VYLRRLRIHEHCTWSHVVHLDDGRCWIMVGNIIINLLISQRTLLFAMVILDNQKQIYLYDIFILGADSNANYIFFWNIALQTQHWFHTSQNLKIKLFYNLLELLEHFLIRWAPRNLILGFTKLCTHRHGFFHSLLKYSYDNLNKYWLKKNNYHIICKLVTPTESGNTVDFKSNQKILIIDT